MSTPNFAYHVKRMGQRVTIILIVIVSTIIILRTILPMKNVQKVNKLKNKKWQLNVTILQ